jgi:hypothetical protein
LQLLAAEGIGGRSLLSHTPGLPVALLFLASLLAVFAVQIAVSAGLLSVICFAIRELRFLI